MATNPRYPQEHEPEKRIAVVSSGTRRSMWPLLLGIVAIAIIAALIWWLSMRPDRSGEGTAVSQHNVVLSNLRATTPTVTGLADVTGTITNRGQTSITGVTVDATFRNINGQNLETVSAQVQPSNGHAAPPSGAPAGSARGDTASAGFQKPGGNAAVSGEGGEQNQGTSNPGFASDPIQARQSRDFVIHFQRLPEGWKGGLPELKIASVDTETGATK